MQRDIRELINSSAGPVIMDGGMGTILAEYGWKPPMLPEEMNMHMPRAVASIHEAYVAAGARVLETNSFGGSSLKLALRGLAGDSAAICTESARLARGAAGERALVAGSVGPLGELISPVGKLSIEQARCAFTEQIRGLIEGGADFIIVETMMDIKEAKAAVLACRDTAPGVPFAVCFTFDTKGSTVTGVTPEAAAVWVENMGAFAVGANCGVGPVEYVESVRRIAAVTALPIFVYPNAGVPSSGDYIGPEQFAHHCAELVAAGAAVVGGCCGTTPQHIETLCRALSGVCVQKRTPRTGTLRLCSRSVVTEAGPSHPLMIIGERINVSRKSPMRDEIRSYQYTSLREEARFQTEARAGVIDINVGLPEIDRVRAMREAVWAAGGVSSLPLSIDSDDVRVLETGLIEAVGSPLINSVTCKREHLEVGVSLAVRYGAALAILTIDEQGISPDAEVRARMAIRAVEYAESRGLSRDRIIIDPLTLTLGTDTSVAMSTCRALGEICAHGCRTVLGISNISHGLPMRGLLNRTFLAMAMQAGLDAVICNPQDMELMNTVMAADALRNRDREVARYVKFASRHGEPRSAECVKKAEKQETDMIGQAILHGDTAMAAEAARAMTGVSAMSLITCHVVPALDRVGKLYEQGDYFLPQLLGSAEAAGAVCAYAESLSGEGAASSATIVIATVEGDLHDLGKNVVGMVLKSHGYNVVDLGKDVPSSVIVNEAERLGAQIIGLSALMTSTAPRMEEVIALARMKELNCKIIVGGAVVSPQYAKSIGSDGTSPDAVSAARLVSALLG